MPWLHFARKSKNLLTAFAITIRRGEQNTKTQLKLHQCSTSMKKKSASQSAFFNLRVLIGLFTVLAGVFLALAGFGAFSALAQAQQKNKIITNSKNPLVPNGFDCSKIHELGIDKQENMRAGAIMIACGQAQGGSTSVFETVSQAIQQTQIGSA